MSKKHAIQMNYRLHNLSGVFGECGVAYRADAKPVAAPRLSSHGVNVNQSIGKPNSRLWRIGSRPVYEDGIVGVALFDGGTPPWNPAPQWPRSQNFHFAKQPAWLLAAVDAGAKLRRMQTRPKPLEILKTHGLHDFVLG
jgi:hypothetical protein